MLQKLVLSSEQPLSLELCIHFSACAHQIRPTAVTPVTAAGKDPNPLRKFKVVGHNFIYFTRNMLTKKLV